MRIRVTGESWMLWGVGLKLHTQRKLYEDHHEEEEGEMVTGWLRSALGRLFSGCYGMEPWLYRMDFPLNISANV